MRPQDPVFLRRLAANHAALRNQLLALWPDLDDETLSDTLDGLDETRDILCELVRSVLEDEMLLGGLSTRMEDMCARQRRLARRLEAKRALASCVMVEAGIQTLHQADFSASLRAGAATLHVEDEGKIPSLYWKPQPPVLDRQALLAALRKGSAVEGARLQTPMAQISVRRR